jgi:uncharacterized protein YybS (DUF2232 family)
VPHDGQREIPKDIATGIAITCLVFLLSVYIPLIGFFCALFIPLPILFYRAKLGRSTGAIVPAVVIVAMMIVAGGLTVDVLFFVQLLLLGFMLCELFEKNLSVEKTILGATAAVVGTTIIGIVVYSNFVNIGIGDLISNYIGRNLKLTLALYESMGVSEDNIQILAESLDRIKYVLVRIIPALAVASTLFVSWINTLIAKPVLESRRLFYPDFGTLNLWQAPEYFVWGVIASGLMLLLPGGFLKMIGFNSLLILLTVYFFQGIAIVAYFFEQKRVPRFFRILLYTLIALQQFLLLVVIGFGFFDTWLNFRKLKMPSMPSES